MDAGQLAALDAHCRKERQNREESQRLYEQQQKAQERFYRLRSAAVRSGALDGEEPVTFKAAAQTGLSIACGGDRVSGMLADRSTRLAAVFCHPWRPMGGSMHDLNVLHALAIFGAEGANITTLRFNFRCGLGRGHTSAADLRGACAFLLSLDEPPDKLLLVGYSYGSLVVADVAPTLPACAAFAMIAPPLGFGLPLFAGRHGAIFRAAQSSSKPKLCLLGSHDQFCTQQQFARFVDGLHEPATAKVAKGPLVADGCGHGGCGHEHRQPVDHFTIFSHLEPIVVPWVTDTFGCPLERLAESSGVPKPPSEVL